MFSRFARRALRVAPILCVLAAGGLAPAQDKVLDGPSDDRWHYPFNGTPGFRANGAPFTTSPFGPFDYRDAMVFLRFRPETTNTGDPEYVRAGMSPDCYRFRGAKVVIYHNNALAYTWHTDSATTDALGNPFQLQIFGMGNDDALTLTHATAPFDLESWVETSPFYGESPSPGTSVRNPHPLNIDDAASPQNVTNVSATPWGTGKPVYGSAPGEYTPGVIPPAPFAVTYTLNIANPRVKRYIQESLAKGRVDWVLSTTATGGGAPEQRPDFLMKEHPSGLAARFVLEDFSLAPTTTVVLDGPSDDRWQYPFNGTPGFRPVGPLFTSSIGSGFDYRDATNLFRFRPNTVDPQNPEYIESGLPPSSYTIASARLEVFSPTAAGVDPFTWDTRDLVTTDTQGNTQAIQLFGMGNNDSLTSASFTLGTWTETSPFFGQVPFPGSSERSPYALNLDETGSPNVTNDPGAELWALGHPVYGTGAGEYTPGAVAVEPFPIRFDLDLSNARVRDYLQQSLAAGRVDWVLSGTFEPSGMGGGPNLPQIMFKENPANRPAKLILEFCTPEMNAVAGWESYE